MHRISKLVRSAVFVGLLTFNSYGQSDAAPPGAETRGDAKDVTPQQVIERMAKAYAESKSYRDKGVIASRPVDADSKLWQERDFATLFIRPDRLRVEVKPLHSKDEWYVLCLTEKTLSVAAGGKAATFDKSAMETPEESALAGLAGAVSEPFAAAIPAMLIAPNAGDSVATGLKDIRQNPDERVDDINCLCISGVTKSGREVVLWIDSAKYLLRQMRYVEPAVLFEEKVVRSEQEVRVTYHPEMGIEIPDSDVRFNPPDGFTVIPPIKN